MEQDSANEQKEAYTRWVKLGKISRLHCVGKHTLAIHSGCHILFHNVDTGEDVIYHADSTTSGDGIHCMAGNTSVPVFAFVEKCFRPRIFVLMFPNFQEICIIKNVADNGLLSLSFSEMEYLFALTSYPNFEVIVWMWRNGEKIASASSGVKELQQTIRCSFGSPVFLAQMQSMSTQLLLWELHVCSKRRFLKNCKLEIPNAEPPCSYIWSPESHLYIADSMGSVYMLDVEKQKIIECFNCFKKTSAIMWHRGYLFLSGTYVRKSSTTDVKTKNIKLHLPNDDTAFKKHSSGNWERSWRHRPVHPVIRLATLPGREYFYGLDSRGHFLQLQIDAEGRKSALKDDEDGKENEERNEDGNEDDDDDDEEEEEEEEEEGSEETLHNYGGGFTDICIIQPLGDHFAALRSDNTVMIWDISSGQLKGTMHLKKEILSMTSHTKEPYVVVGTAEGTIDFINVYNPEKPVQMAEIFLSRSPVSYLTINYKGTYVVGASLQEGRLFAIKSDPGKKMDLLGYASVGREIIQPAIFEYKNNFIVLVLIVTRKCCNSGDVVQTYILEKEKRQLVLNATVHLPSLYIAMYFRPLKPGLIFLVPHRSRQFEEGELPIWVFYPLQIRQEFKQAAAYIMQTKHAKHKVLAEEMTPWVTITSTAPSGHQLRRYWLTITTRHVVSYGVDGLVFLRTDNTKKTITVKMTHHRTELGIKRAFCTPLKEQIVSLGHDGSIVCTNTGVPVNKAEEAELRKEFEFLREKYQHKTTTMTFKSSATGVKTCLEQQEEFTANQEAAQYVEEKSKIYQEFRKIQKKIGALLDENQRKHPEQQLPVSAFDLDINGRKEKLEAAEKQREAMRKEILARIAAQDKLCNMLKERYWETMEVKRRHLKAIMGQADVENYALEKEKLELPEDLTSAKLYRKLERQLQEFDYYNPWDENMKQVKVSLVAPSIFDRSRDLRNTLVQLENENAEEEEKKLEDKRNSFSGSTSYCFIKCPPQLHYQPEINTQLQIYLETTMLKGVTYELRQYFNTLFDRLYSVKENEIKTVSERNDKMRHIISELKIMTAKLKGHRNLPELDLDIIIEDPHWTQEEIPENIMKVEDDEVSVTPYISPSEEALLEKQRAEEEARRLALLADDFRERALIVMMDGVLERRWEDEIKKDIPAPKVMSEKNEADFTLEDLQQIKKWEQQVEELMNEREKYRKILIADFGKVSQLLADGIYKFNSHLADLILTKLKVESAIAHEEIKMARARCRALQRQNFSRRVDQIRKAIARVEQDGAQILTEIQKLQSAANECRNTYDQLTSRDRHLDATFKKNFPDCSQIVLEQLYKLFKRRPKMQHKASMSVIMVNELSRCSVSSDKPSFLPTECIDFLKGLDTIDNHANCPPNIHEELWNNLCRIRRQKVECELKMRACALELAEAEQTVHLFQKQHAAVKEQQQMLKNELQDVQNNILEFCLDVELQLVLKMGMIETPLSGKLSDFNDAILISRAEIEGVNELIRAAGRVKLGMMRKAMKFHRKILCREWEHKKMKMEIEDLEWMLHRIEKTKLTKQMMLYLKKKKAGISDDKIIEAVEREWVIMKDEFAREINELHEQLKELDEKTAEKIKINKQLDTKITALNLNVSEQQLQRDLDRESRESDAVHNRMAAIMKRSRLINKIQRQHAEVLELHAQLELSRLRTYPTLKHKSPL